MIDQHRLRRWLGGDMAAMMAKIYYQFILNTRPQWVNVEACGIFFLVFCFLIMSIEIFLF